MAARPRAHPAAVRHGSRVGGAAGDHVFVSVRDARIFLDDYVI